MSYARRVAYNTLAQIIGRVFTTITSLATVSILNGILRPEGWGGYVAVTTYLGFFSVLADMGLNLLYLRELSRKPEEADEVTSRFLGFRLFTATVVLLIAAPLIGMLIPAYQPFSSAILLMAIGQFFLTMNQVCVTVVQARLMMDRAMISDLVGRVAILAGTVYVGMQVAEENRFLAAITVVVLGNALNMVVSWLFTRKLVRFRPRFLLQEWPGIFMQVLPIGAMAVLGMIHFKADSILLTLYRPEIEVGIYGNAYKVLEIIITLPAMFVGGLFPEMNQLIQRGSDGLHGLMQKAFDLLVFAAIPVVTGIVLFAPHIIAVLTRNYIPESALSLRIVAFAMIPLFIGTLMAHALLATEKQKQLSIVELVAVILNIGLNVYLIPKYSYYGAGSATVITEVLTTVITTWLTIRVLGFYPRLRTVVPALVGAVCMAAMYFFIRKVGGDIWSTHYYDWSHAQQAGLLLLVIAVSGAAYVVPFFLFKQFPPVIQERLYARFK
ncbi:MAG TPA: flippase [Verrucomicrobiae bacterium]|nr:flippase [Verrucomicrobiae bacterium]